MEKIQLAVNGTLMRGLALNENLTRVGAEFVREARTSPNYRMWSIDDAYPAMIKNSFGGNSMEVEIWELSHEALLDVLRSEPPGLTMGKVQLDDGEWVFGILGEPYICEGRQEITRWGSWRKYLENMEK
jgi:gamma-glutamylcyclotransferase (GGCT)/AIG2-like uncharacterized protein YtfP